MKVNRRAFLGSMAGACAAAPLALNDKLKFIPTEEAFAPPRDRLPNPYMESGKPIAVIVSGTEFAPMLKKAMDTLGGFAKFGKHPVMIKPNFLLPQKYPLITSDQSIIDVIEALQVEGFSDISITELGSDPDKTCPVFKYYGLEEKAAEGGYKIKDLYGDKFVPVFHESWKMMRFVNVCESIYNAPFIINMPTIKNHSTVDLTCSLKNNMGPIDFKSRMEMHRQHKQPIEAEVREEEEKVCVPEIAHAINPDLTIIDARKVMGGHHNNYRYGKSLEAGKLIVSADPVLADRLAAILLAEKHAGFRVEQVEKTLVRAAELGLGVSDLGDAIIKEI